MIAGRMKADQLGGPIRIAQASGEMASVGIGALLQLAAVLSVSIGLLNLMPVPVLDGGHLLFYAIEAVRGRPVGPAAQEIAFRIGLAMVLSLRCSPRGMIHTAYQLICFGNPLFTLFEARRVD